MNTPPIHPLYYKVDNIYYRITEIERSWSTELGQYTPIEKQVTERTMEK